MDRNGVLAVFLFILLIVVEGSDASLFGRFRSMVGIVPKENSDGKEISPSPSPVSTDPNNINSNKSDTKSPQDSQLPNKSPKPDPKNSGGKVLPTPQTENPTDNSEKDGGGDKRGSPGGSQEEIVEKCKASSRCTDGKNMTACLRQPESGSQELFILVQNDGESTLKVKVTAPANVKIPFKELELPKHQVKKINISVNGGENPEIVLHSENGNCVLHTQPSIFEGNFFQWVPSYATRVTPIYVAYFLFLTGLIVGGTWACCKFRKRRLQGDGVPYQELEMGIPESVSAVNVDTVHGWDQGWDDDWDEEKAVKSPGTHVGNVSANGLTSRSPNRDGWENDWDD